MLPLEQRMEQFSFAYIRAVAAAAGYAATKPEVDYESVDLTLHSRASSGLVVPPRIEIQVKSTAEEIIRDDLVVYRLKKKNYDDLRGRHFNTPRLLVVVRIPSETELWLAHSEEELTLRRCGYWLSLRDHPERDNVSSVTVEIPRSQRFDAPTVARLMRQSSLREALA